MYSDLIDQIEELRRKHPNSKIAVRPALDFAYETIPEGHEFEFDYWRGSGFNKDFSKLEDGVTVHYYSDNIEKYGYNFYNIYTTEFWVSENKKRETKILSAEELRYKNPTAKLFDNPDFYFTRYLHCEFDTKENKVIHFDIALRLYSEDQYSSRFESNDLSHFSREFGKISAREKLLQFDGAIYLDEMLKVIYPFFHNNPLLFEYFEEFDKV